MPSVRRGCAAARELLLAFASKRWGVEAKAIKVHDGKAVDPASDRSLSYADWAADKDAAKSLDAAIPADVALIPIDQWKVLGTPVARPNGHDLVTGVHAYPSDITRPGMVYGKVLRAPAFGATLISIDLGPAQSMKDVTAIRDGDFIGVTAPNSYLAGQALQAIADTARWKTPDSVFPSSAHLFEYLESHARGGVPANPFADVVSKAARVAQGNLSRGICTALPHGASSRGRRVDPFYRLRQQVDGMDGDADALRRARRVGTDPGCA